MPSILQAVAEHVTSSTSFFEAQQPRHLSAGYDTSPLGGAALTGLVELKTAADFLNLSKAQASHLKKVVLVTKLRALEASNVLKYLQDNNGYKSDNEGGAATTDLSALAGGGKPKPMLGQFASGPGFGLADPKERSYRPKDPNEMPGGGMLAAAAAAADSGEVKVDMIAIDIKKALQDVLELSHKAVFDSQHLQSFVVSSSQKANLALRLAAKDLNYPGLPGEAFVQPSLPTPKPKPGRPPDLAPAFLDFVYASKSQGTDAFKGLEEHNVFGSPPVEPTEVKVKMAGDEDKLLPETAEL